jgi:hypothetical protein
MGEAPSGSGFLPGFDQPVQIRSVEEELPELAAIRQGHADPVQHPGTVAERVGVKSIPTILVFRHGREVARLDALITDRDLRVARRRSQ